VYGTCTRYVSAAVLTPYARRWLLNSVVCLPLGDFLGKVARYLLLTCGTKYYATVSLELGTWDDAYGIPTVTLKHGAGMCHFSLPHLAEQRPSRATTGTSGVRVTWACD
jgi:hypothetical protein